MMMMMITREATSKASGGTKVLTQVRAMHSAPLSKYKYDKFLKDESSYNATHIKIMKYLMMPDILHK